MSYNLRVFSFNPPPTTTAPNAVFYASQTIANANPFGSPVYTVNMRLNWSSSDPEGISSQQLQQLSGNGLIFQDVAPQPAANATSQIVPVTIGKVVQFRVRAIDGLGNTGSYAVGARFTVVGGQEGDAAFSYTGAWKGTSASEAMGGGMIVLAKAVQGDMATFSFVGGQAALVGTLAPDGGMADIYVDGVLMKMPVDFYSDRVSYRQVIFAIDGLPSYATDALGRQVPHTITIKWRPDHNPASTGFRLYIDGGITLN
jgi:hypothetical protein